MRGHRNGSITHEYGRFRVRVSLDDGTRLSLGTYATKEEAEDMLAESLHRLEEQEMMTGAVTVAAYGERVLDARERSGLRGVRRERSAFRTNVASSSLGTLPLRAVTRRDGDRWIGELLRRPSTRGGTLARGTVVRALRIARAVFDQASSELLIDANPLREVRVPSVARTDEPWTFLTLDEIERVTTCEDIPLEKRSAYIVGIYAGLRAGELWGLRWDDVRLDGRPELVVRHSYRGPTKAGRVGRVPLLAPAVAALRQWRDEGTPHAHVWPAPGGGCFADGYDGGWADRRYRTGKGKLKVRPGHKTVARVSRPVRFHDLRHTCASHLVMGSWGRAWRLEEVREMLRHSTTKMTERYAHLAPDALHSAAAATATSWPDAGRRTEDKKAPEGASVPIFSGVERRGIEPRTFALPVRARGEGSREVRALSGQRPARELAIRYLRALVVGDPIRDRVGAELAEAVLAESIDDESEVG
mgnify:CR=1 FL=1